MTGAMMSDRSYSCPTLYSCRTLSAIDRLNQAPTREDTLAVFEGAVAELGADYFGIHFLPRPKEDFEEVCLAWHGPAEWRELYSSENFCHADAGFRYAHRTVMPFDWASAPYDPETEPRMREVVERSRDFNMHKALIVPIPSPSGVIGVVGIGGPHFDERAVHAPVLQSFALHAFHRLEQFISKRGRNGAGLTEREREVLSWAADGKTAWEIGCILHLSHRTVEGYFYRACQKLGAANRTQAIAIYEAQARSIR